MSAGIERLNGVKAEDVLRDPGTLHRQSPPELFEQLARAEAASARELTDFDMEVPMRRPDGQVRWMRLRSRPRRLHDGGTPVRSIARSDVVLRSTATRSS
jgi:PAS domain-containing protein